MFFRTIVVRFEQTITQPDGKRKEMLLENAVIYVVGGNRLAAPSIHDEAE